MHSKNMHEQTMYVMRSGIFELQSATACLASQHGGWLEHRRDVAARHISIPLRLPGICIQDGVPCLNVGAGMLHQRCL